MHPYSQPVSNVIELRAPVGRRHPTPRSSPLAPIQRPLRVLWRLEQIRLIQSLAKCGNPLVLAVALFVRETGLRPKELLRSTYWRDIDWERHSLWQQELCSKNFRPKVISLSDDAMNLLQDMGPGKPNELIFNITYVAFIKIFQRVCYRAGLQDVTLNDWRRTTPDHMIAIVGRSVLLRSAVVAPIASTAG